MEKEHLIGIIEASLFAAGEPLSMQRLLQLFAEEEQPSTEEIQVVINELQENYQNRAIHLKELATGFSFVVAPKFSRAVAQLWEEKPHRYSRALHETLAIIAYRQPITRAEIEDIRGVAVSTVITKTLLEREWVRIVGHKDVPGRPALYATTRQFLEHFSLQSLEDLPPLAEIVDLDAMTLSLGDEEIIVENETLEIDVITDEILENEAMEVEITADKITEIEIGEKETEEVINA